LETLTGLVPLYTPSHSAHAFGSEQQAGRTVSREAEGDLFYDYENHQYRDKNNLPKV
jgi:hypothetical protein